MDWIKKHSDQFALALLALGLLVAAILVLLKSSGFAENFSAVQTSPAHNDRIAPLDKTALEEATANVSKPSGWDVKKDAGSLFVSHKYLLDPTTHRPVRPGGGGMLNPPVPDDWLLKYELNLLSSTVLQDDPDGDGFSNLDEYLGADRSEKNEDADSTNPKDKESHPPYYTKLFLKQYIAVPFRLKFQSYDGDPKKPDSMSFQINTLDLRQPTVFLKFGDNVPGTKFKLEKFELKSKLNESTGSQDDVSELTVLNTETAERIVLVLEKVINSPDSYALFSYLWPSPPRDIRVKKLQEFVLVPNTQEKYKLIDISETGAQIALPSGEKYTVPLLPK